MRNPLIPFHVRLQAHVLWGENSSTCLLGLVLKGSRHEKLRPQPSKPEAEELLAGPCGLIDSSDEGCPRPGGKNAAAPSRRLFGLVQREAKDPLCLGGLLRLVEPSDQGQPIFVQGPVVVLTHSLELWQCLYLCVPALSAFSIACPRKAISPQVRTQDLTHMT